MGHIRVISTTAIQPTSQNELTRCRSIELTPCDLQFLLLNCNQKGLLFHKPTSTDKTFIQNLKSSFSRTLDIFYPFAGRLVATGNNEDNTTSFSVDCIGGAGAQFVHAAADGVIVADIIDPVLVPDDIVYSLFPMNGVLNYQGMSEPLLAVQVTELVNGIFIAGTMNHCVADGASFYHFFNTWSEISRCGTKISQQPVPVFGREFLDGIIDLPVRIPFFHNQIPNSQFSTGLLQQRMLHFSKEKTAELKAKANAEMGTTNISSLQALMGHLWVSITRNKCLNADQQTKYRVLVGMRQRLQPPLADHYFGNAVLMGIVTSTAGDLLKHGLGWAALKMNNMIASQTEQELRKDLVDWVESPKLPKLDGSVSNTFVTGSSPRFNVFGNDFGWGRPLAVRSGPGNKFDGKLTVFPGAEQGSIDFEACLAAETLKALAEDAEFTASLAK